VRSFRHPLPLHTGAERLDGRRLCIQQPPRPATTLSARRMRAPRLWPVRVRDTRTPGLAQLEGRNEELHGGSRSGSRPRSMPCRSAHVCTVLYTENGKAQPKQCDVTYKSVGHLTRSLVSQGTAHVRCMGRRPRPRLQPKGGWTLPRFEFRRSTGVYVLAVGRWMVLQSRVTSPDAPCTPIPADGLVRARCECARAWALS